MSFFCEALLDLIHVWHDDRNWSKILYGTIANPVHGLYVKVTDLEFLCKFSYKSFMLIFFQFLFFAKPSMDFIHFWYDD